ncbi:hypothetical protein BpHYR1_054651, partial [Brachionus plicatilis]
IKNYYIKKKLEKTYHTKECLRQNITAVKRKPIMRRIKQSMNPKRRKEKCPLGKLYKHLTTPMMQKKV